ncbi:DNA-processing protein DprA [bacterium]|nr:DNA-processing protein DprA [bacterium]
MSKNDRSAWIALSLISGIGSVLSHKLSEAFGSPQAVFEQARSVLSDQKKIGNRLAASIAKADWQGLAKEEEHRCTRQSIKICTLADADYPGLLKAVPFAPVFFYYRGSLLPEDKQALAVVGSRRPTGYGIVSTRELVSNLAGAGLTIVSGLAMGIDTVAHQSALKQGARTLAVVAHGLDRVYPRINKKLFEQITEHGAVISEFRLGVQPLPAHFPQRNRLISGLARGVLVVEAGETSGSLITARWAGEQNRDVFAVPGMYHSALSKGTHALIRDGAKLVTTVEDILSELPDWKPDPSIRTTKITHSHLKLQGLQADIYGSLRQGGMHVDQIALACRKPVQRVMLDLLTLEIQGRIRSEAGQIYHWIGENAN